MGIAVDNPQDIPITSLSIQKLELRTALAQHAAFSQAFSALQHAVTRMCTHLLMYLLLQATLAAANVAAVLTGAPVWSKPDNILPFIEKPVNAIPHAAPSIVNAKQLGLKVADAA
jgi:hypothetical protein